jgi:hypothetical protein
MSICRGAELWERRRARALRRSGMVYTLPPRTANARRRKLGPVSGGLYEGRVMPPSPESLWRGRRGSHTASAGDWACPDVPSKQVSVLTIDTIMNANTDEAPQQADLVSKVRTDTCSRAAGVEWMRSENNSIDAQ